MKIASPSCDSCDWGDARITSEVSHVDTDSTDEMLLLLILKREKKSKS